MTPPKAFDACKAALLALGGQRVWPLVVSLFGDLAQAEGSVIDGPVLSAVMGEMDVRPEALRVALHRLRNDGWITSQRHGRTGRHALTPASRLQTREASTRIYARPDALQNDWHIALLEENPANAQPMPAGFIALTPRVYLGTAQSKAPDHALVLTGTIVPDWLREQIAPKMLDDEYRALLPLLQNIDATLPAGALGDLHIAVLRCLVVHNWRRLVLRTSCPATRPVA